MKLRCERLVEERLMGSEKCDGSWEICLDWCCTRRTYRTLGIFELWLGGDDNLPPKRTPPQSALGSRSLAAILGPTARAGRSWGCSNQPWRYIIPAGWSSLHVHLFHYFSARHDKEMRQDISIIEGAEVKAFGLLE